MNSPLLTIEVLTAILAFDLSLITVMAILYALDLIERKGYFVMQSVLIIAWFVFLKLTGMSVLMVAGTVLALLFMVIYLAYIAETFNRFLDKADEKRKRKPQETASPTRLEDDGMTWKDVNRELYKARHPILRLYDKDGKR